METQLLYKQLRTLGFKEKTAKVYLTLLSIGTSTITEVAKHSGLKRPIVYVCMEELAQHDLVASIMQGKRVYYQPRPFDRVLDEQINKVRLAQDIQSCIKQIPALNSVTQPSFYQGRDKFVKVVEEVMRGRTIYTLAYIEDYWEVMGEEHIRHVFEVIKRAGGYVWGLAPKTDKIKDLLSKTYRKGLSEYRFLPDAFDMSNKTSVAINERMVIFTAVDSLSVTVIKDPNIVKLHKQMWRSLWEQSEPFEG